MTDAQLWVTEMRRRRQLGSLAGDDRGTQTLSQFVEVWWAMHVLPNLDVASDRWVANTAGTRWFRAGAYALVNLRVDYDLTPGLTLGAGGRNLGDDGYVLADGFPEAGRSFFLSVRARY